MLTLLLLGCGADPCPYGSLAASPSGLEIVASEHPSGWARPDCEGCHALAVLHDGGCTPDVDVEALRADVAARGYDGCVDCHGDNGVVP